MKQILLPILATAAFIIAIGIFTKNTKIIAGNPIPLPLEIKTVKIGDVSINAEIANSEAERTRGLGERKSLKEDSGMLFVFDKSDVSVSFWMKDMVIPIDIIWINDGKVAQISRNAKPEPDTPDDKLKLYLPNEPVDYVIEVNAGFSDSKGIKVGDPVVLPSL